MIDFFDLLYKTRAEERAVFGDRWCGPEKMTRDFSLVARFTPPKDSDGRTVEIHCAALPARFYEVRVLPGLDYQGKALPGYILGTGSGFGMAELAAQVAGHIADGMVVLRQDET